jgi:uncharacterized protein (DUF3084 family)
MDELQKQVLAEKENVEIALENLRFVKSKKEKTVIELAAIGTFLHNIPLRKYNLELQMATEDHYNKISMTSCE